MAGLRRAKSVQGGRRTDSVEDRTQEGMNPHRKERGTAGLEKPLRRRKRRRRDTAGTRYAADHPTYKALERNEPQGRHARPGPADHRASPALPLCEGEHQHRAIGPAARKRSHSDSREVSRGGQARVYS